MNKVFALFITVILSSCPLSAAQFGPGNVGNAQGMGGGGFGNGDGFDQGSDNGGGIDGPDDMDNLQPPAGNNSPPSNMPQRGGPTSRPPVGMDGGDYGDPNDPSGINDDGNDLNNAGSSAYAASAPGAGPNAANPQGGSHQQKLKGMDYVRQLQNALLEGNKKSLCDEGGVCRKNFGEGCKSSKNFLSVCATICSDIAEFRGSHCLSGGAKRYKMNPQTMVYNARPDKQKPAETTAQHIAIQLREGRKALRDDKRLFFNTFCTPPAVQMIPDNDRTELALACLDFLYNGYPPESAVTQVKTNAFVQAPQAPTMCPTVQPQPAPPPPPPAPPPAPAPATNDDVATPLGGLANAGVDKGAQYDGKLPAIVEDKEGGEEDCDEPKKK
ncbi:hypothetical protein [Candidatus Odyssella thessalonicensis]|uniref:hypothetical protein n=1 Tax=Candidatus Odyssella thessalonicensis TaxID=84647 RepID=UPI000225BE91|nr:hypothetical protein [Candidatus Odyssella thessalonicensis]